MIDHCQVEMRLSVRCASLKLSYIILKRKNEATTYYSSKFNFISMNHEL